MITFLGVIVLLLSIAIGVWNSMAKNKNTENAKERKKLTDLLQSGNLDSYDTSEVQRRINRLEDVQGFPLKWNAWVVGLLAVGIFTLNGLFFWAEAGTAYAVQYPWGGDKMIKTQGIKTKFWGRTIPLSYEISLKDVIVQDEERLAESRDGIYNRPAKLWEFSDAIKAEIATAVVVGVDVNNEEVFLNMADRNRSESKLIYGRVVPNIDAALKNTCKLMDAQEYISGKASDFDRYFRDQLENGMYLVEEYVQEEELPEIIGEVGTVRKIADQGNTNKQTKYRIKRDEQGNIIRDNKSNTLVQYGIKIYQAQVTGIDWESSFDERLQLQKEQVAQTQLEKQEAEKEYYRAKKEIAKGESEKAAERARLEKEQIKLTIAAETEAKVATQNVIAEKRKVEVAKLAAASKKIAADAQFYENAKLVQAGLTPQERAELELKKASAIAQEFAKMRTPEVVIINGGNGKSSASGESLTTALIQAEMAKNLINKKQQ